MGPWAIACFGQSFGYADVEIFVDPSAGGYASQAAAQAVIDEQQNPLNYQAVQCWTQPSQGGGPSSPFNPSAGNWMVVSVTGDGAGNPVFFPYGGFGSEAEALAWIAGRGGIGGMSAVQVKGVPA